MAQRDYYEILGVAKDSDQDTIKKAYRKLAMQFHPDKNPGNKEAEEKFKEAASAFEVLHNPEKKARYDRFGHAGLGGAGGMGNQGFQNAEDIFESFSDIFSDFFGMGGQRGGGRQRANGPRRGADLRYMCEIKLGEVITGIERELEFDTEDSCDDCSGTGVEKGHTAETCPRCKGQGQVIATQGFFQVATTCPQCRGAGQIIKNPCTTCKGQGRKRAHRKIRVNIPAGVDSGTRLRVSNEGEGGVKGGPRGDLYVELRVEDHPRFERDGNDLYSRAKISYTQALLGGTVEVETFDGKHKLEIPKGTAPGQQLKLDNLGVPNLRNRGRGHLFFECEVEIPKKLTKDEEKLLREIAQIRGEEPAKGKGILGF